MAAGLACVACIGVLAGVGATKACRPPLSDCATCAGVINIGLAVVPCMGVLAGVVGRYLEELTETVLERGHGEENEVLAVETRPCGVSSDVK